MMQDLIDQIENLVQEAIEEVHTAMPGLIESVDYENGTADVRPVLKKHLRSGEVIEYPLITEVPIVFPQGAGQDSFIVFPVRKGDGCLLIVSENALDCWQFGMETEMDLPFDLSNAVCIPGLFSRMPSGLKEASENGSVIVKAGSTVLTVSPDGMKLKGSLTVTGTVKAAGFDTDD